MRSSVAGPNYEQQSTVVQCLMPSYAGHFFKSIREEGGGKKTQDHCMLWIDATNKCHDQKKFDHMPSAVVFSCTNCARVSLFSASATSIKEVRAQTSMFAISN